MIIKLRPWEKQMPIWLVWAPERGETEDDACKIEASDAAQAAEDFAEWSDNSSAEYSVARGNEITVHVRGTTDVQRFSVIGEYVASYTSEELT
jgi:hypothetical protein